MNSRSFRWFIISLAAIASSSCDNSGNFGGHGKVQPNTATQPEPAESQQTPSKLEERKAKRTKFPKTVRPNSLDDDNALPSDKAANEPIDGKLSDHDQITASTPEKPLDISESGFACANDMTAAEGPWEGSWQGDGFSGRIKFDMKFVNKETLHLENFILDGGATANSDVGNGSINFDLRCRDHSFPDVELTYRGTKLVAKLSFTGQSWTPPSLSGTWTTLTPQFGGVAWKGTWQVKKN